MRGPTPKPADLRQRRNRASTEAALSAGPRRRRQPALPDIRPWHALTRRWWRELWRSPMADEYLESDLMGLQVLAALVDQFWTDPQARIAAEIRQLSTGFGLTPIDRRRLQWEMRADDAGAGRRGRPAVSEAAVDEAANVSRPDPRRFLQAV